MSKKPEKKTCIFGETLEGGFPKMLVAVAGDDQLNPALGDYVGSCLEDLISGVLTDEEVTIEFTVKKMTQEEIDALPDL